MTVDIANEASDRQLTSMVMGGFLIHIMHSYRDLKLILSVTFLCGLLAKNLIQRVYWVRHIWDSQMAKYNIVIFRY